MLKTCPDSLYICCLCERNFSKLKLLKHVACSEDRATSLAIQSIEGEEVKVKFDEIIDTSLTNFSKLTLKTRKCNVIHFCQRPNM